MMAVESIAQTNCTFFNFAFFNFASITWLDEPKEQP